MTADFLKWFLAQKPRKFRLVNTRNFEYAVDEAEHIQFCDNDKILVGPDLGMGRRTVSLDDIEEIRQ